MSEATLSLRWIIPFLRVTGGSPGDIEILRREGIGLKDFANPDTRMRHAAVMELLAHSVSRLNDPCLGLRAGERFDVGDLGALEYAARSCENMRESILTCNRYMYLMHSAQESRLEEDDAQASWQLRVTDDVPQLPAANDFAVTSAVWFARQHTGQRFPLREVHFQHAQPTSESEYARVFDGATVRCSMPWNGLVFDRSVLYLPMAHANTGIRAAFEDYAEDALRRLRQADTLAGQVRQLLLEHLRSGELGMPAVAARLGVSEATLRRRLAKEGASFSELLADVRHHLAKEYLADTTLAISEVAFLLGFSHVSAFYKSFSRSSGGATPAQVRAQLRRDATK